MLTDKFDIIIGKIKEFPKDKQAIDSYFENLIKNDQTFLEKEPLSKIGSLKKLNAFKHNGFWQCMDTVRDKEILEKAFKNNLVTDF